MNKELRCMHHHVTAAILSAVFFFAPAAVFSDARATVDATSMDGFLRDSVKKYRVPGLAVAIVDDSGVLYAGCFGYAAGRFPVTPGTRFAIGSTTKTFTALAVLELASDGKIDLDSPVKTILPKFEVAEKGFAERITVRHLLNHTSALSDSGMPSMARGEASLDKEVESLRLCVPSGEPGVSYRYFNGNYRVLGAVVERASGMRYEDFLRARLFGPLSMNGTGAYAVPADPSSAAAEGHGSLFGFPIPEKQPLRAGAVPSGYIASNLSDIAIFLSDELRAGAGEKSVLDPDIVKQSWTPWSSEAESYAMGWISVRRADGSRFLVHGGSLEGFQSFFYLDPARRTGFAMLMNQGGLIPMSGGFNAIRDGLVASVGDKAPPRKPGPSPLAVVIAISFAVLFLELFLFARLGRWKRALEKSGAGARRKAVLFFFLATECLAAFLPVYLIPFMNSLTGERGDWPFLWSMLPEAVVIIGAVSASSAVRLALKAHWLMQSRNGNPRP